MQENWTEIQPRVNEIVEFTEISTDFGDPLEVIREAISNSYDAGSTQIKIHFFVEDIEGIQTLVLEIEDNGEGMSEDVLKNNFWDLGNSANRPDANKIGEKGHGTKIYLRSKLIKVITHHKTGSFESICINPFSSLKRNEIHRPKFRKIEPSGQTGTFIRLEGYNNNERANYLQNIVKDYINWFTKHGSFEAEFPGKDRLNVVIQLKCLDKEEFEEIKFGHIFAQIREDINKLFEEYKENAIEYFVKKYTKIGRLEKFPEKQFEAVIYVEGDKAKREYNPLISSRRTQSKGQYKVSDRYGIWLAKDFIPIQRKNEWISGFGSGSNAFVLLHGFINCQALKLTANRGSISNTDPEVLKSLEEEVKLMVDEIDEDLTKGGLFTLKEWQEEEKTLALEKAEFQRRKKMIASKRIAKIDGVMLLEPTNESEFFGLFNTIYAKYPEKFEFEPLDYNTNRGVDMIGRNKTALPIADCEFWYIEFKYLLSKNFNHSFNHIRWVICWDFSSDLRNDSVLTSSVGNEERTLKIIEEEGGRRCYFLDKPTSPIRIQVLKMKEFMKKELSIEFA